MATKELTPQAAVAAEEKAKLKAEKKQFKQDQKAQKKEARRRAAEIAKQEEALGEDGGNGLVTFFATVLIVVLWLAIVCVVIKMDIGGFGSSVLAPILGNVPVVNKILPATSNVADNSGEESYGGYSSIEEAVDYIRQLEQQLESAQTASKAKDTEMEALKAEISRLQEFEERQAEFQRIKNEFYEEVVYSDKGPGIEEFMKYFESMDEATAEYLYKQGLNQQEVTAEVQEFVSTIAKLKPKKAASIMEQMTDKMDLVVKTLKAMSVEERAAILEQMDDDFAAKIIKLMDPDA